MFGDRKMYEHTHLRVKCNTVIQRMRI